MEDLRSKFNDLKFQLGKKYGGNNYKVLKFCLFDYIPIGTLTVEYPTGHTLFNELDAMGVISPYDVDLLLEITTLTGPRDAKALVIQYMCNNNILITNTNQLTLYRKQLYRAVTQAELGAINNLAATYGFNVTYTNLWDAVFELESDERLANEPRKLKKLGQNLGQFSENELLKIMVFPVKTDFNAVDKITAVMDSAGGTLYLKDEDIKLVINPGSIEEGKKIQISLENIWGKTSDPVLNKFETIVSPTVRCGPPGTVFKKHCILSFPYNAVNEKWWEFTLLVKENFQDEWRRIKLGSYDKDIHFYLHNGRCVVNLIHFTNITLLGYTININRAARKVMFGVFGKHYLNKYQLRVRTWNLGSNMKVTEDAKLFGEKLVEMPTPIDLLYEDLVVRVQDVNNGWQISEASRTQTFSADDLWTKIPWRVFKFTRSDPPSDVLEATISSSQATNVFQLKISCETRQENIRSKVHFWYFISALTVVVIGLIIAWTFDNFQAFLTSHSGIALFLSGLIVALITYSIMWKLVKSATPAQIVACVFLNMSLYYLGVWMCFGFVHPLTTVNIIIILSVYIIAFLVAVVLFGEIVLKFVPFIGLLGSVIFIKLMS